MMSLLLSIDRLFCESDVIIYEAREVHCIAEDSGGDGTTGVKQGYQYSISNNFEHTIDDTGVAYRYPLPMRTEVAIEHIT
jgi:hypothetical protein